MSSMCSSIVSLLKTSQIDMQLAFINNMLLSFSLLTVFQLILPMSVNKTFGAERIEIVCYFTICSIRPVGRSSFRTDFKSSFIS